MKINRSKGSLQNQLQKMLQAGIDNVEAPEVEASSNKEETSNQEVTERKVKEGPVDSKPAEPQKQADSKPAKSKDSNTKPVSKSKPQRTVKLAAQKEVPQEEPAHKLNAAQRREVPDHNVKYAGEPIKSVGCRMPQSLYARMLQYKAMNDSQLHRITLNDVIIEAVEKFMDENS